MKKIPTMFVRDKRNPSVVTDECHPDCLWVFQGFGRATRKYDGTACLIECGMFYKRRAVKADKPTPEGFIEVEADSTTAKLFGWLPVGDDDRWHREAIQDAVVIESSGGAKIVDGTYELVGPKVQGNPEGLSFHTLISHTRDVDVYEDVPRVFDALRDWLSTRDIEGLVFQHPDGRMAKIKKRDFGLARKPS